MANKILSLKNGVRFIHFEYFDNENELEVWIEEPTSDKSMATYITASDANSIINHLVSQLQKIGKPVVILQR